LKTMKSLSAGLRRDFFAAYNNEEKYIFDKREDSFNSLNVEKLNRLYDLIEQSIYSIKLRTNLRLIMVNFFAKFKEIL